MVVIRIVGWDEMGRFGLLVWCKVLSIMDMLYVVKSYGVKVVG
ncbi:MAG: hypothetical protein ACK4F9_06580 [Brevinematia bacterium]